MSTKFTYCYASILVLLDLFDTSDLSSDANSFYSPNEDVRYLVDSIPVSLRQELAGGPDIDLHNLIDDRSVYSTRVHLKFFPPVLDFKQRDFGVPYHETVAVVNTSGNRSVHMSSISGNTVHFHSSFFQDKVIPPLSNTTFDVVFLGRGEGEIKSTLFIHTSEGSFKYHVRGESSYSPYRLRSLSGVRLPLNASYSPLIVMHNPHSTSIQLSEVYSSSGEFHLELPSGDLEGPRQIWSVPAFLTKPIIRLRFHASSQKNHTAYIRLKVDETGEILIIPIDIEVDVNGGLYAPDDLIDFGIGGTGDQPKVLKLYLKNSGKRAIKIQDVYSMPYSKSLNIDFQPVTVSPDHAVTEVATLAFDWKSAFESGETFGKIFVKCANSNQRVVLSYTATVLDGGLFYDSNQTKFQSDQYEIEPRTITMTNRYKVPVTIFNISLASEAAYYFQVVNFEPFIFHPGETRIVMVIEAIGGSLPLHLKLESEILVFSNVSTISIPILCYDGKLAKVLVSDPNDTELYFGTVGSGTLKMVNFALVNENPVAVQILDLSLNMTESTIYAAAVEKGNSTTASIAISSNDYNVTLSEPFIGPGYFCIVQVSVPAGPAPGNVYGEVKIETEFEVIRMPLFMRVEHGSLRVVTNPVEFNDCFPSAICMAEVRVESNFTVGMAVTGVSSIPFQPRLGFIPASPPLIPPLTTTLLGHVTWDMSGMESYLTPTTTSIGGHTWLDTLSIPRHVREWDISLLNFRYAQYSNISTELIELSLRLDTTEVRNVGFKAIIKPTWPSVLLLSTRNLSFPLTQVGKASQQQLTIINPASKQSIILQLIFDSYYPLAKGIVDDLPTSLRPPVNSSIDGNEYRNTFQFVLEDEVKTRGESDPDKNSLVMYLKPFSNVSVSIAFKPERAEYSSSILLIRNNLTILEAVHLYGRGAYAHFKFGNRKPGSSLPLLFEVAEKHLKDCDRKKVSKNNPGPNLTVKRSFTARNIGALPLSITGFSVNGHPCQGFGFRVLNCHPFLLPANASKKIDIAFTPDFTLSRVERMLTIYTSALSANYTLTATLPPYLLATCSSTLSRPTWEPIIYYCSVTLMVFLFVCVLTASIFESNRILRNTIIALSREQNIQPVLDLRAVGTEVTNEPYDQDNQTETPHHKMSWNHSASMENDMHKMVNKGGPSTPSDSCISGGFHNKSNVVTNGVIHKRRPERSLSKRFNEYEGAFEKTSWNTMFSRSVSNPPSKSVKTSNICFTTEPYTPLANLKQREATSKTGEPVEKSKLINQSSVDASAKRPKKKNEEKKKIFEPACSTNNIDDGDTSSTTTESSSNYDGDKEVESMFFKTVRHHLQSKITKPRTLKYRESPPNKSRKSTEKSSGSPADNEWDPVDDVIMNKAIVVVRSCRRPNSTTNKLKRQSSNSSKLRLEQVPLRNRLVNMEKVSKTGSKREKGLSAKKPRMDKSEKAAHQRGALLDNASSPAPPPTPVWTASFSDIVARSDCSYSSIVALKHSQSSNIHKNIASNNLSSGPSGSKHNYTATWKNWAGGVEPVHHTEPKLPASANSLFAHSPQPMAENAYDNLWNDPNMMYHPSMVKVIQDQPHRDIGMQPSYNHTDTNNWPVMPSLWEPLYTPSARHENPLPVWGSDVWAPPSPPSHTAQDEGIQHTLEYDPFRSLSNIWSQHSTNIWKPPTTE